jgi:hypothetical protein
LPDHPLAIKRERREQECRHSGDPEAAESLKGREVDAYFIGKLLTKQMERKNTRHDMVAKSLNRPIPNIQLCSDAVFRIIFHILIAWTRVHFGQICITSI